MARQIISSNWDRENRNSMNQNFEELYKYQDRAIKEATEAVIEDSKLIWQKPVNNFNAIATTYPNPENGWTVMTRDTGKVYRYFEGTWSEIQEIDVTPVNEVDSRLSAEINTVNNTLNDHNTKLNNHTEKLIEHTDKIQNVTTQLAQAEHQLLSDRNTIDFLNSISNRGDIIYFKKKTNPFDFEVVIPSRKGKGTAIEVIPDIDGFARIRRAWNGNLTNEEGLDGGMVNYARTTGAGWVKSSTSQNHYTTNVGNTFELEFEGTGFSFVHYANDQGGVWEFSVDGVIVGTVSTYSETPIKNKISDVVGGLVDTKHTVVATFKGDDPDNPPSGGAGTSRGWVVNNATVANDYSTILTKSMLKAHSKTTEILHGDSVKEFAWSIKENGATYGSQWIPSHGESTSVLINRKLIVDNKEVTNWFNTGFTECSEVILSQSFFGRNENNPTKNLIKYDISTIFNTSGVSIIIRFEVLTDIVTNPSYNSMLPVVSSFPDYFITNKGEKLNTDSISGDDPLEGYPKSVMFVGGNHAVAMSYENFAESTNYRNNNMPYKYFLQHREEMQKYYPRIFYGDVIPAGNVYRSHARMAFAELEKLSLLVS